MYRNNNIRPGPSRHSFSPEPFSFYNDYGIRNNNQMPLSGPPERMRDLPNQNRQFQNQHYQNQPYQNQQYQNQHYQSQQSQSQQYQSQQYQGQQYQNQKGLNIQYDRKRYQPAHRGNREQRQNTFRKNQDICLRAETPKSNKKSATVNVDNTLYTCPGCSSPFDCLSRCNRYVGNVPLILNCKHTICQECIYQTIKDNSVICPVCKNPSVLSPNYNGDNLQEVFLPNFHLFGLIVWSKCVGNSLANMMLIPSEQTPNKKTLEEFTETTKQGEARCCFLSCNRTASLHCQDCNDVYCPECCALVHKSAKSLWSHKQVPLHASKVTLELEKCSDHGMDMEFFCKTCEAGACCYCLIAKHEGHEKDHLSKLDDSEMAMLQTYKEKAMKILHQLIVSQKRMKKLHNYSNSMTEKKICNYFVDYHAKLQFFEKNIRKELSTCQTRMRTKGLDEISSKLSSSINTLKNIIVTCNSMDVKSLNLREVLNKLKDVINTPCYLINEHGTGLEPIEFEVDSKAEATEECFKIKIIDDIGYSLVAEDDLPPNYEKDLTDLQYESDAEICLSSLINSAKNEENRKKKSPSLKQIIDIEKVDVTHIESLECFYVQLKKTQFRFLQMNQDIENYIKMGAATVDQPQLNELYLALYVSSKEKVWCRGRVTEIKNGETEPLYEVFFIDYGSTQTLDITKLREIPPAIASKKAYAIQCELQNPSYVSWSKNAHVYMGKMINSKDVFMSVKNINSGVHLVDLMVSSSDGGLTSIIDILIHTCTNALSTSSDNESSIVGDQKFPFNPGFKIFTNSMKYVKNQVENVIVANVIDPHHIFVHIAAHAESLKKLASAMKNRYKNSQKNACIPIEGTYVAVEHRDPIRGNWHRALIKKFDITTEKVHVMLVDWGLNVVVPRTSVRMLTESFTKLESQAVLVKMAHIEPLEKAHAWSERATVFLQKYFRTQDVLKMIVHNIEPLEVALFEVLGDVDMCINAQLVKENLAESTGKISQTVEWLRNETTPKGFTEDEGLVASLLKKADESTEEDESEDENDKKLMKSKIDVVKFVDPSLIYIKFSKYESREHELHKELQVHYSKERNQKDSWTVGEDCVVLHLNNYARAKILAEEGNGRYRVNVYDKPAEIVLSVQRIFEYAKYFNKYPNIVFKSHLANIRPAGGDKWSMSSTEALERLFDKYKDIYGTKVPGDTTGKSFPMHMWYTQVKVGGALEASITKFISINNRLVKLGFAYKNQPNEATQSDKSNTEFAPPSALASVFEKIGNKLDDSTDSGTDRESQEIAPKEQTSFASTNDSAEENTGDVSEKAETQTSSTNWADIIEEEERETEEKKDEKQESPYHTREADIEDWIPAFPIDKREFNAWITCAETEGYLYLRDESLQVVYHEMETNIKEYFDNQPPKEVKHIWKPGHLCTIAYNGGWYRGKVFEVNSPDDVVVFMIDFGSDHNVSPTQLSREIMFPEIPAFASKIKLDKVYAKSGAWLTSDYETLRELVTEYAKIIIKGPLEVDVPMAEVFTDKGVNVNKALVQRCPNLTRSELVDGDNSDEDGVVIEEEAIVEIDDEEEVGKVETSTPIDTSHFEYKMDPLPEEASTENTMMFIMAILAYNKVVLKMTAGLLKEEIFELTERIQKCVENQPVLEKLEVGMPCICPYNEDGLWYRAQIYNMDGIDCSYVFVFFVDFGNVESVSTNDIRMMKPEWFDLPVTCHIAELNIELKNDNHTNHVLQHIRKLLGKNKLARIVGKEPLTVSLHEPDGSLCYQMLIDSGLLRIKQFFCISGL